MLFFHFLLSTISLQSIFGGALNDDANNNMVIKTRKLSSIVTTQIEFENAITQGGIIELMDDIYLESELIINNITSLEINGNGFKIDGQFRSRCLKILYSSFIHVYNLNFMNGYTNRTVTYIHAYIIETRICQDLSS